MNKFASVPIEWQAIVVSIRITKSLKLALSFVSVPSRQPLAVDLVFSVSLTRFCFVSSVYSTLTA